MNSYWRASRACVGYTVCCTYYNVERGHLDFDFGRSIVFMWGRSTCSHVIHLFYHSRIFIVLCRHGLNIEIFIFIICSLSVAIMWPNFFHRYCSNWMNVFRKNSIAFPISFTCLYSNGFFRLCLIFFFFSQIINIRFQCNNNKICCSCVVRTNFHLILLIPFWGYRWNNNLLSLLFSYASRVLLFGRSFCGYSKN